MRWLTIVGYACAALLLFLVFLYLTLPYEAIGRWLVRQAEMAAGARIQAVSVERLHPLGLRWHGVAVGDADGRRTWVTLSSLSVKPLLLSLVSRRKVVLVEAELAGGVVEGAVEVGRPQSDANGLQYRVDLTRVDGLNLAVLQPLIPAVTGLNGRLSGNLSYEWTADQPLYGTGTLFVDAKQVTVAGKASSPWPIGELRLDQVTCGASLEQGRASLSNCAAAGPSGEASVSGTAQLQMPVMRTMLALRVEAAVQGLTPAGGPPLTATVRGPLGGPQFQVEGGLSLSLPSAP